MEYTKKTQERSIQSNESRIDISEYPLVNAGPHNFFEDACHRRERGHHDLPPLGGKHVEITVQQSNMRPIIVNDAAIRPQGCAERCLRIVLAYLDFGHRFGFFINQLLRDEEQNVLFRADIHVETCQVERTGSGNVANRCVVKTALEKKSGCDVDYFAAPLSDQILVLDRGRNFLAHGASA